MVSTLKLSKSCDRFITLIFSDTEFASDLVSKKNGSDYQQMNDGLKKKPSQIPSIINKK
jgi:hypothetical protein